MAGPRDVIVTVLAEFVDGVEKNTGCQLDPGRCKFFSPDETAWEDVNNRQFIPESLRHIQRRNMSRR